MNNNFYDIPENWYKEFNDTFYSNNMTSNQLATINLALDRGNLFNNLYDPYKNYKYNNLTATNKREELLLNVLRYDFVLTELNLYLDIYPKDRNMINLYNQYLEEKKRACFEYTKNFGPLTLDDQSNNNSWSWLQSPWPWEGTK
ncbi:MAG: spore coat protein CotJB [Bacilli bacterium]|nr:spore coat protein CotJB [Bacilli bacterium]